MARNPRSSVFHTVAWLEALHRTYGYEPTAFTTSPPGTELENGIVVCRVTSWITGRRLVSLPFSDHCQPLVENAADEEALVSALMQAQRREKSRYVEVRAKHSIADRTGIWRSSHTFCIHQLSLEPDLVTLFANCHKSSTQRKVQRAVREGLTCETGRSEALLGSFWTMLVMTRRKHGVPPQPKNWFRNLIDCFGERLEIRVAFKEKRPLAAILTLRHRDTLVYKYGCSDARFHRLGGMQMLFWQAIGEAKSDGLLRLDLGRSDCENTGLITFKDRLGAARSNLAYMRFPVSPPPATRFGAVNWAERTARRALSLMPDRLLCLIGRAVYRHIA